MIVGNAIGWHAAQDLGRFFQASTELMQILARACGHRALNQFTLSDLTTWKKDIANYRVYRLGECLRLSPGKRYLM